MDWEKRKLIYDASYYDEGLPGHYTDWWWTDLSVWGPRARVVYEVATPSTALVCGCAKGSLVKTLHSIYGVDATGFDLSQFAIDTTPYPEIRDRLSVVDLAMETLPIADKSMDVVTCYDFLEHNDDAALENVIAELSRVCNRYILIRTPMDNLMEEEATALVSQTTGLPFSQREKILRQVFPGKELIPDEANIEHPNTMSRKQWCSLFDDDFTEVYLDSYFYDIMMGSNPECKTPVLPFYDTIVLRCKNGEKSSTG